jgi:hypothetical protein
MEKEIIHMSLSGLLKSSAKQLCYLRKNRKEKPVTNEQLEGNEAALKKSEGLVEMRGTYEFEYLDKKILIHYAFDELKPNDKSCLFIEHKNIKSGSTVELWYRNACILQTAAYQAFAKLNPNKHLETATFHVKDGYEKQEFELGNRYLRSELHFGNYIYSVLASTPEELVDFYKRKAIASLEYDPSKEWDGKYKFKEYDFMHANLAYRILKEDETIKIK